MLNVQKVWNMGKKRWKVGILDKKLRKKWLNVKKTSVKSGKKLKKKGEKW